MIRRACTIGGVGAVLASTPLSAQETGQPDSLLDSPGAYEVFRGDGTETSLEELLRAARDVNVVFLGETHDDPVGHDLQLEIFRRVLQWNRRGSDGSDRLRSDSVRGRAGSATLSPKSAGAPAVSPKRPGSPAASPERPAAPTVSPERTLSADPHRQPQGRRPVVLSLEMFERDVQYVLHEYLDGLIPENQFLNATRPWPHYELDYKPLVELARAEDVRVLAANAPRRYVNLVAREGPDALKGLSAAAKHSLPPLPYAPPSAGYRAEFREAMGAHGEHTDSDADSDSDAAGSGSDAGSSSDAADSAHSAHGTASNAMWAQALWDATMAYTITEELLRRPESLVIHLVGAFHVRNGTGLPEHLARYRPGTRTLTVIVEPVEDTASFPTELIGAGNFVVLTDRSHQRGRRGHP